MFLVTTDTDKYMLEFQENAHPLSDVRAEILRFKSSMDKIQDLFPHSVPLRMHQIALKQFKQDVQGKVNDVSQRILLSVSRQMVERSSSTKEHFDGIVARIKKIPRSAEELSELQEYIAGLHVEVNELEIEIADIGKDVELLNDFQFEISQHDVGVFWEVFGQPSNVIRIRAESQERQEEERMKFMQELHESTVEFKQELSSVEVEIEKLYTYSDFDSAEEYAGNVQLLQMRLKEAKDKAVLVNSREKLFNLEVTDFEDIDRISKDFEPYANLWTIAAAFNSSFPNWMYGPFTSLDAETIEQNVMQWWKYAFKAERTFEGKKEPQQVAKILKEKLDQFKPYLPIIQGLRTPGMRDRHWAQLSTTVGVEIKPDVSLTLKYMLELGIEKYGDVITEISEVASKEYSFERNLERMKQDWRDLTFELQPYKDTGTFVVRAVDDIITLLDDQIVKVQAMRGSPYAKALENVVLEWNHRLFYMQEVLDEWLKLQKTWLYLEPIFASPDIMRQMPTEGRRFQKVDQIWRATMDAASQAPQVLQVMAIENLKANFVECNKMLDVVQKGLNDYLETKRSSFPRFYFLSNDELLDILSETKDPRRVVPHLSKCFEAINDVQFRGKTPQELQSGEKNLDILAMVSGEGEVVPLATAVEPDAERNRGSVERWLLEMETSMRDTLKDIGQRAFEAYKHTARTQFVQEWTGMIVLAADCLFWTKDVEEALRKGGVRGVTAVEERMQAELADIVQLVRGSIGKQVRLILGAMVVLDVHNKDVVTLLIRNNCSAPEEFDWNSQLRYYLQVASYDAPWHRKGEEVVMTRMMNASLAYGYEYLGNSMRLVVTPLTDRCYRTLFGALHLSLGGAPEGPAGTGKTETVKDLAKAIAKQCIVFNCSDGLDYLAMAKFFKGLASCGAWACFDEFNRIDLEVLSVIAQQILSLNDAIRRGLPRLLFEGSDIVCIKGYSSFITMNPGYAGRSELPDNLKALFRPCAMMVPDYAMISEICLYSYGFSEARDLARKLVKSLQISSEQLSSQVHYDFGMRAVKSILTAAGLLKLKYLEEREDVLVLRAINDVNLPKFVDADLPLFEGITSDLFLGLKIPSPDYSILMEGMQQACGELTKKSPETHGFANVQPTANLLKKCIQLYETITVRHSLMVVGLTMSMKTSVFKVLQHGMCNVEDKSKFEDVLMYSLNPKSITIDQIYGNFDPVSREWIEGIGASLVRKCAQMETSAELKVKRKWIMFDGPVDAIWIENMNTVMDDNKKLCLNSGEIIKLTSTMTMVFEPEDLAAASPATVSRNGMVLMEPHMFQWQELRDSWFETLPPSLEGSKAQISKLLDHFVPPLLRLLRRECKEPVVTKDTELVMSLFKLFKCMLDSFYDPEEAGKIGPGDAAKRVDGGFLFSLIWSVGCSTDLKGRMSMTETLRTLLSSPEAPKLTAPLPDKGSMYDWCFDQHKGRWLGWLETIPSYSIPAGTEFQDILVPTMDTVRYTSIMTTLLSNDYHCLFVGDTGTGKSVMVKDKLMRGMGEKLVPHFMNFSAQTKANQTQDIIDGKVDKRRKGVFGPPLGKKMVVFVDDLNMPAKETYGAQPPIEILRQWMHWGGWWDRKEIEWRTLIDMVFVSCMGLPGGGRTHITCRYTRWYNIISVTPIDEEGMSRIFSTILNWFMQQFPSISAGAVVNPVVQATLEVFTTVSKELLPTPLKSHYTFNLRDLAKV
ncbi:hypothetical protein GUITHDRAFT_83228, partial [Guillardia theta CCMP2712]